VIFYLLFINKDVKATVFVIAIFAIYAILKKRDDDLKRTIENNVSEFVNSVEKNIENVDYLINSGIYSIYRKPDDLKFIKKNNDMINILQDLKPLEKYDKNLFLSIAMHIEYYLEEYDRLSSKTIHSAERMNAISNEVLNLMHQMIFAVPKCYYPLLRRVSKRFKNIVHSQEKAVNIRQKKELKEKGPVANDMEGSTRFDLFI
jgi:hypothetical protein